jgi:hypothetical protein
MYCKAVLGEKCRGCGVEAVVAEIGPPKRFYCPSPVEECAIDYFDQGDGGETTGGCDRCRDLQLAEIRERRAGKAPVNADGSGNLYQKRYSKFQSGHEAAFDKGVA